MGNELSKDAVKFEFLLAQHKLTFDQFYSLVNSLMQHGELFEQWDKLPINTRLEIGKYHGDKIPAEVEKELLAMENSTNKKAVN